MSGSNVVLGFTVDQWQAFASIAKGLLISISLIGAWFLIACVVEMVRHRSDDPYDVYD